MSHIRQKNVIFNVVHSLPYINPSPTNSHPLYTLTLSLSLLLHLDPVTGLVAVPVVAVSAVLRVERNDGDLRSSTAAATATAAGVVATSAASASSTKAAAASRSAVAARGSATAAAAAAEAASGRATEPAAAAAWPTAETGIATWNWKRGVGRYRV